MDTEKKRFFLTIPIAIVIAGVIIGGAIWYQNKDNSASKQPKSDSARQELKNSRSNLAGGIRPVSEQDHILGSLDAPVKLIEYSDLECPFCKQFHNTMKRLMAEYGVDNRLAWVYRHFPIDSLHPKAPKEAEAAECAAELGGNDKFWAYIDKIFSITPSNNGLNSALLPQVAVEIGLDKAAFEQCLNSGKYASHIEEEVREAFNAGAQGTPYNMIVTKNGQTFPFSGALPYEEVRQIIEQALNQ